MRARPRRTRLAQPGLVDLVAGRLGGMGAGGGEQAAAGEVGDGFLDRRLREPGPGRDGLKARTDPGTALAPARAPEPEIDQEGRGGAVVADQVAHQYVGDIGVE